MDTNVLDKTAPTLKDTLSLITGQLLVCFKFFSKLFIDIYFLHTLYMD